MHIALALLPLLGRVLLFAPAAPELRSELFAPHAFIAAAHVIAGAVAQGTSCPVGQAPSGAKCVYLPVGARAAGCPSGIANGAGGCAPTPSAPPQAGPVVANVRPRTSVQALGGGTVPWTVAIEPATNFVPIGNCLAVYIGLIDASGKDIPRNPTGSRVQMQDFDWTATGNAAVGKYSGPNAWAVCACPGAVVGSTVHVMATYPAASLPEKSKVPGLAFQSYIELPIAKAPGTNVPAGCDNALVTTTVAISVPGGTPAIPAGAGGGPLTNPPAVASTTTAPPASTTGAPAPAAGPQGQAPYTAQPYLPPVTVAQAPPSVAPGPTPPSGIAYPANGTPVPTATAPTPASPPAVAPTMTPVPIGTATAAPTAAASGRYRVVATGFRVLHQTKDDFLSRDGHGDEVYGGFLTFHYDRNTSKLVDQTLRRTNVIGEQGFDGLKSGSLIDGTVGVIGSIGTWIAGADLAERGVRLKGGSASPSGGFAQNDVFPAVADPSKSYGVAPTDNTFPFLVWEGSLTSAQDAVVILPTLWEFDGFADGFQKWYTSEKANVLQIWSDPGVQAAVASSQLALVTPPGTLETSFGPHMSAGGIFELAFVGLGPIALLTTGSYDRPIGVGMSGVSNIAGITSGSVLPRRAIVITREIIEASLARLATYNAATQVPGVFAINGGPPVMIPAPPPGTIGVQLFESPTDELQGMYIMYLHVEKLP